MARKTRAKNFSHMTQTLARELLLFLQVKQPGRRGSFVEDEEDIDGIGTTGLHPFSIADRIWLVS